MNERPLRDYERKRDFRRTPEPRPRAPRRSAKARFVVHRHEARRLHYDLRLEFDGVLKSWAVPRGFSYDPKDKRLAVHTEDHPIEYLSFEGVIPPGQYGAGTMTIWDAGTFEVTSAELEAGKLEFLLAGGRLRGEWHLVRTRSEKDEWLIFKSRDVYARDEKDPIHPFDLRQGKRAAFPRKPVPMEPRGSRPPFSAPDFWFEMKFAGRRVWMQKRGDRVRLVDGAGRDWAPRLPGIVADLQEVRAGNALGDGILVALDGDERPSSERLAEVLRGTAAANVQLYLFDLLYCEEFDLRGLPLRERKAALAWILPALPQVLYVDHVEGEGEKLAQVVRNVGFPGILAKDPASPYTGGPAQEWWDVPVAGAGEATTTPSKLRDHLERRRARSSGRIAFTNLKKVLWPESGITKGDLIDYYDAVAEVLVPYLRDRPLHLHRFPNGIQGKSFYQKNVPDHLPEWVPTVEIPSGSRGEAIRYLVCNDRDVLLYVANSASIDLHPWLSRCAALDSPDYAVLDLDPKEAPFEWVVRIAKTAGQVLRGIGLRPFLKTSGKTGLHIYVPLEEGYQYDHSRMFCEGVARFVVRRHPDIATVERGLEQRQRRVYVDFLQNRRGQTVVPPYSVRPVPRAPVSTPLDWDELDGRLDPAEFNLRTLPRRLARSGDGFQKTLTDRQDLLPAIARLQELVGKSS